MTQDHELLAEGLGWAEGPTVLPDGRICFVESYRSQVSVWERGRGVSRYAYTAGGPNSCVLGDDGTMYVCQNGGTVGPWRAAEMSVPSIQRIAREGGRGGDHRHGAGRAHASTGPTTSCSARTAGSTSPTRAPTGRRTPSPATCSCWSRTGPAPAGGAGPADVPQWHRHRGRRLAWSGPSRTRAWCAAWTRAPAPSRTSRACRARSRSRTAWPWAADGRLYVTTVNGGGIDVINADGTYDRFIRAGVIPTNCVFAGRDLIMTDAGVLAASSDASYGGQLWRLPIEDRRAGHLDRQHRLSPRPNGGEAPWSSCCTSRSRSRRTATPTRRSAGSRRRACAPVSSPRRGSSSASGASPARWANCGLWEAPDATAIHDAVTSLPMWPYLDVTVHPLGAHPNDPGSHEDPAMTDDDRIRAWSSRPTSSPACSTCAAGSPSSRAAAAAWAGPSRSAMPRRA